MPNRIENFIYNDGFGFPLVNSSCFTFASDKVPFANQNQYTIDLGQTYRNVIEINVVHAIFTMEDQQKFINLYVDNIEEGHLGVFLLNKEDNGHDRAWYMGYQYPMGKRFSVPLSKLSRLRLRFTEPAFEASNFINPTFENPLGVAIAGEERLAKDMRNHEITFQIITTVSVDHYMQYGLSPAGINITSGKSSIDTRNQALEAKRNRLFEGEEEPIDEEGRIRGTKDIKDATTIINDYSNINNLQLQCLQEIQKNVSKSMKFGFIIIVVVLFVIFFLAWKRGQNIVHQVQV